MRHSLLLTAVLCSAFVLHSPHAAATMLEFGCITGNSVTDCAIGEAQLTVEVIDFAPGQVQFVVRNTGPAASSVTDVYFDDGTLLGIASLTGSSGVSFSQGAAPPNLPGGSSISPPFEVTAGFLADSDSPPSQNGVNPGEWLTVLFNLQGGGLFGDVISELQTGELRVGLHVQAFAGGGSESFVNMSPVPLPAAGWLLLSGLGMLGTTLRRRRGKCSATTHGSLAS